MRIWNNFHGQSIHPKSWGRYKTWTLDSGLDYGLDYGVNFGLDFGLHYVRTNLVFWNFPGLPAVQFLTASILVPKGMIIQTFKHSFSVYNSV